MELQVGGIRQKKKINRRRYNWRGKTRETVIIGIKASKNNLLKLNEDAIHEYKDSWKRRQKKM